MGEEKGGFVAEEAVVEDDMGAFGEAAGAKGGDGTGEAGEAIGGGEVGVVVEEGVDCVGGTAEDGGGGGGGGVEELGLEEGEG